MSRKTETDQGTAPADRPTGSTASKLTNGLLGMRTGRRQSKSTMGATVELIVIVLVAVALALLIQAFLVKPYKIPSGSMEPTLKIGQRVLVDRIGNALAGPHVGEIAVFHPPRSAEEQVCGPVSHRVAFGGAACDQPIPEQETKVNFIKRIVAGPGDTIYVKEGHVYRKAAGKSQFVPEKDSYINPCTGQEECSFPTPIKIPAGHWFMMGDNRGESDDSRFWGPVPTGWIIGGAFFTYWPLDRLGGI